jgi:hypothetical protein
LFFLIGLGVLADLNMTARFANDSSQADLILVNSVASHNDMFRELLYCLRYGDGYRIDRWQFLQTPLSFAMPSFLGFGKSIPLHLIDFNLDRAGIDLVGGEGNVFPGLLADMYLCFGDLGPFILAAMSGIFWMAFWQVTLKVNSSAVGASLFVTLLAYHVICFRNIQGSLGILVALSFLIARWLSPRSPTAGDGTPSI